VLDLDRGIEADGADDDVRRRRTERADEVRAILVEIA